MFSPPLKCSICQIMNDGEKRGCTVDRRWCEPANRTLVMIELSRYVFETLREEGDFALCRGRRDGELPAILLVAPVSEYPDLGSLERLEHEYSLRRELDSDWAVRPLV